MKKFYEIVDGKEKVWNPSIEEFLKYKEICFKIWGGMPLDVGWAKGTQIYKNADVAEWSIKPNASGGIVLGKLNKYSNENKL
jgi:hypothetical protein